MKTGFPYLHTYLSLREEQMEKQGFRRLKIDLSLSDIRCGAITTLEAAREIRRKRYPENEAVAEFIKALEQWASK